MGKGQAASRGRRDCRGEFEADCLLNPCCFGSSGMFGFPAYRRGLSRLRVNCQGALSRPRASRRETPEADLKAGGEIPTRRVSA